MENRWNISAYTHSDCGAVVELACASFGAGYMSRERIENFAHERGSFFVVKDKERLIGYSVFLYETVDKCAETICLPKHVLVELADGDCSEVCLVKSLAVSPEYRKQGMAEALFMAGLQAAFDSNIGYVWASAWKIGDIVPMGRIFLRNKFTVYGEIPLIWYNDKDYSCIVCGGPCRCTGVIYYKCLRRLL